MGKAGWGNSDKSNWSVWPGAWQKGAKSALWKQEQWSKEESKPQQKGRGEGKGKSNTSFAKYDSQTKAQVITTVKEVIYGEDMDIVKNMQTRVSLARKAKGKTWKLAQELTEKRALWQNYKDGIKAAFKAEFHRYQADTQRWSLRFRKQERKKSRPR